MSKIIQDATTRVVIISENDNYVIIISENDNYVRASFQKLIADDAWNQIRPN